MKSLLSHSPRITKKIAFILARECIKSRSKRTVLAIGLQGNLGSGKTTFIQGFAKGLGINHHLTSPTFLIIRSYKLPNYQLLITNYRNLYHIDCYRIKKPAELYILDFRKIISDPKNIVLIEWADKIRRILPKKPLWIEFKHGQKENERIITLRNTK